MIKILQSLGHFKKAYNCNQFIITSILFLAHITFPESVIIDVVSKLCGMKKKKRIDEKKRDDEGCVSKTNLLVGVVWFGIMLGESWIVVGNYR